MNTKEILQGIKNWVDKPAKLGFGVGVCSTAAATAAKTVSITDFKLKTNGFVAVTFQNDVPAGATLNINSLGAKPIFFKGEAIVANVINAGDTVTFCYDGTNYVVACPLNVSKVTIRTWEDAQKTTPITAILDITLPDGTTDTLRIGSTGITTIYCGDGSAAVSSLYATLDVSSITINGDTTVDIVVTNTLYVDLGLPSGTLWAIGNLCKDSQGNYSIGNPTDIGIHCSWGNIDGYNPDEIGTGTGQYKFTSGNYALTPGSQVGASIASNDAEHDIAFARLGSFWHLPTFEHLKELVDGNNTTYIWTTVDDVYGLLFTSLINSRTLFIPLNYTYYDNAVANNYLTYNTCTFVRAGQNRALNVVRDRTINTAGGLDSYRGAGIRPVL